MWLFDVNLLANSLSKENFLNWPKSIFKNKRKNLVVLNMKHFYNYFIEYYFSNEK